MPDRGRGGEKNELWFQAPQFSARSPDSGTDLKQVAQRECNASITRNSIMTELCTYGNTNQVQDMGNGGMKLLHGQP